MSQLLQVAFRGGTCNGDATGAIVAHNGGIPYTLSEAVAITVDGAVSHHHQGLPFTSAGRLVVSGSAVDRVGSGAAPFIAANRLAIIGGTTASTVGGVNYVSARQVRMSVIG